MIKAVGKVELRLLNIYLDSVLIKGAVVVDLWLLIKYLCRHLLNIL